MPILVDQNGAGCTMERSPTAHTDGGNAWAHVWRGVVSEPVRTIAPSQLYLAPQEPLQDVVYTNIKQAPGPLAQISLEELMRLIRAPIPRGQTSLLRWHTEITAPGQCILPRFLCPCWRAPLPASLNGAVFAERCTEGTWQAPSSYLDMYTPRLVRIHKGQREGLCPIWYVCMHEAS
ncbi:hypothetical protein ACI68E_000773 [Malassezia pachydermatis]